MGRRSAAHFRHPPGSLLRANGRLLMKEIQGRTKQTRHVVDIPNLVELQLNSYRWFLEEGLHELFESFSPIYDFTGNTSISLTDFTLGEPKYSVEECRDRDKIGRA